MGKIERRTASKVNLKFLLCVRVGLPVSLTGTEDTLRQTEVTGNKDVDGIQRSVGETVGNLVGSNGIAGGVGDAVDKNILRGNV